MLLKFKRSLCLPASCLSSEGSTTTTCLQVTREQSHPTFLTSSWCDFRVAKRTNDECMFVTFCCISKILIIQWLLVPLGGPNLQLFSQQKCVGHLFQRDGCFWRCQNWRKKTVISLFYPLTSCNYYTFSIVLTMDLNLDQLIVASLTNKFQILFHTTAVMIKSQIWMENYKTIIKWSSWRKI